MRYVEMTIDEAVKYCKGKKVLVAEQDLEKDEVVEFHRKTYQECTEIIKESETIAKICDDFINQLRVFSEKQKDLVNIRPIGKMSTILVRDAHTKEDDEKNKKRTSVLKSVDKNKCS